MYEACEHSSSCMVWMPLNMPMWHPSSCCPANHLSVASFLHEQKLCLDALDLAPPVPYIMSSLSSLALPVSTADSVRVAILYVNLGMPFLYFLWATQPSIISPFFITSPFPAYPKSWCPLGTAGTQQPMLFCNFFLCVAIPWILYSLP